MKKIKINHKKFNLAKQYQSKNTPEQQDRQKRILKDLGVKKGGHRSHPGRKQASGFSKQEIPTANQT